MQALRNTTVFVLGIVAMLILATYALAEGAPAAPMVFTPGASSTINPDNYGTRQTDALAGNITWITLTGISQTRAWQGYWGNVSGWVTLDDVNNYTFYNWSAAEPRGMIYASLVAAGTPSWQDVVCMNHTANATNFQTFYNISQDDYDNVTITYNVTSHPEFYIIDNAINDCPTTYIWRDDAYQTDDFVNVLLVDPTEGGDDGWIFGAFLENKDLSNKTDISCYNGENCDFQLIVAENGHGTDTAVTPYYFWVDLSG